MVAAISGAVKEYSHNSRAAGADDILRLVADIQQLMRRDAQTRSQGEIARRFRFADADFDGRQQRIEITGNTCRT